jgi:hypothetical protein
MLSQWQQFPLSDLVGPRLHAHIDGFVRNCAVISMVPAPREYTHNFIRTLKIFLAELLNFYLFPYSVSFYFFRNSLFLWCLISCFIVIFHLLYLPVFYSIFIYFLPFLAICRLFLLPLFICFLFILSLLFLFYFLMLHISYTVFLFPFFLHTHYTLVVSSFDTMHPELQFHVCHKYS